MQNTNPTGTGTTKSISEHIEAAKAKGYEVIVIGAGEEMKHAAAGAEMAILLERMSKLKNHIVIIEDIDKILSEEQQKKNMEVFQRPPIPIRMLSEPLPEITLRKDDMNKQWYEKFAKGKKKRKW